MGNKWRDSHKVPGRYKRQIKAIKPKEPQSQSTADGAISFLFQFFFFQFDNSNKTKIGINARADNLHPTAMAVKIPVPQLRMGLGPLKRLLKARTAARKKNVTGISARHKPE